MSKPSPFDFVRGICSNRDPVAAGELEVKDMNVFMVTRALGHRMDCQAGCELVNLHPGMSKHAVYLVLRATVPKRSARKDEAWAKSSKTDGVDEIKRHFGVGEARALEILETIGAEGVMSIVDSRGGTEKRKR
jgi:hypothetical protein